MGVVFQLKVKQTSELQQLRWSWACEYCWCSEFQPSNVWEKSSINGL